jgi:hypothetical protein
VSCGGCKKKKGAVPGALVTPPKRSAETVAAIRRGRAIMCHVCIYAEHGADAWGKGAVACTISGRPVAEHIRDAKPTCPRKRHGAIVRWMGVRWFGVPHPIRVTMRHKLTGPVPGCGCIVALKTRWERHKARRRRNRP